ncbi:MAG: hypothetical protein NTY22_00990 [Proteobacteria bacterium]|nr:hypothetical protein [Pseudomonadota bacterium]
MNKKQFISITGCVLLIISCFAPLWVFLINPVPPTGIYTSRITDIIENGFVPKGEFIVTALLVITIILILIKKYYYIALGFSLISLAIIVYDLKDMVGYFQESKVSSTAWSWGWYTLVPGILLLVIYVVLEIRQAILKD